MAESGGGVLGEGAASSPPARGPEGALYALLVGSEAEPQPPNGFTTFQVHVLRIASPGTSVSDDFYSSSALLAMQSAVIVRAIPSACLSV